MVQLRVGGPAVDGVQREPAVREPGTRKTERELTEKDKYLHTPRPPPSSLFCRSKSLGSLFIIAVHLVIMF